MPHGRPATRCCSARAIRASELFGIVSGRIAILTRSPDGRESLVAVLDEGSLFGELGLFDDGPRSADARALEETPAHRARLRRRARRHRAHPTILWVIVRLLARRLRNTDESLADAVFLDVPARTAKRLLEIAGDADQFRLPMTQEDLAGLVGASRERVNKALSLFTRLGWIEVEGRNRYRILDRQAAARAGHALSRSPSEPLASVRLQEREHPAPRVGGVVGAVRGALGRVHEAVLGLGVHDDLAVGPVGPRGAQRLDVGCGRERVVAAEDRERRAHLGRGVERQAGLRADPARRADGSSRRTRPRGRSARSRRPSAPASRPCRTRAPRPRARRRAPRGSRPRPRGRRAAARRRAPST